MANILAVAYIEKLQRKILIYSYSYYELNQLLITNKEFDDIKTELNKMKEKFPEDYKKSRYFRIFEVAKVEYNHPWVAAASTYMIENGITTAEEVYMWPVEKFEYPQEVFPVDKNQK